MYDHDLSLKTHGPNINGGTDRISSRTNLLSGRGGNVCLLEAFSPRIDFGLAAIRGSVDFHADFWNYAAQVPSPQRTLPLDLIH